MTKKRLIIILSCILGMTFIAGLTFMLLSLFVHPSDSKVNSTVSKVTSSQVISNVLAMFRDDTSKPNSLSIAPLINAKTSPVTVQLSDTSTIINLPAKDGVLISSNTQLNDAERMYIVSIVSTSLSAALIPFEEKTYEDEYATFTNDQLTCTLFTPASAPTASFACTDTAEINSSVDTVRSLQNVWNSQPTYSLLSFQTEQNDSANLALLTAFEDGNKVVSMPVFSKKRNEPWMYQVDLIPSDKLDETGGGKVVSSSEFSKLQNDPVLKPLFDSLIATQETAAQ